MKKLIILFLALALSTTLVYAALTSTTTFRIVTNFTSAHDLGTSADNLNLSRNITFANGSGADQAQVIFHDLRSLADDANEVLDFYASGSLLDPLGTALTMTKLKFLYVKNTTATAGASLHIGGGTVAAGLFDDITDILILPPQGTLLLTWPSGLTITTNKDINFLHDGTGTAACTYEIIAMGND